MMQMAQKMGAIIVPVGCNGSDKLYPGGSPFAKRGKVVYRIGEPLNVLDPQYKEYRVPPSVVPFSREANEQYGTQYQALTDIVMDRLNDLLDPEYQYGEEESKSGQVKRFV